MSDKDNFAAELRSQQAEYERGTGNINEPLHYNHGIQTTDYICSWGMNFCEGNIVKYVTRWKYKDGVDDLKKARWYINKLISDVEKSQSNLPQKSQSNGPEKSQSKSLF